MRLSEFMRVNIDRIVATWAQSAGELLSVHDGRTDLLCAQAQAALHVIANTLDRVAALSRQNAAEPGGKGPAVPMDAGLHDAVRAAQEVLSVGEIATVGRSLRITVMQLWSEAHAAGSPLDNDDLICFNEAIDYALADAMASHMSELEQYSRLFDTMLSSSPDLSYIFDVEGKFIYANTSFSDLYGIAPQDMPGKRFDEVNRLYGSEMLRNLEHTVQTGTPYRGELPCDAEEANQRIFEYLLLPVFDAQGRVEAVAGTARDVTERKASEEDSKKRANYDSLTNLPNRALFRDRLEHEVKRSIRTRLPMALMFLDLDGFKEVNDRHGHEAGDALLQQCAHRLCTRVRDSDTVARLGGDEFTVMLGEVHRLAHIEVLAREILQEMERPFSIQGNEVRISASIGIALMPHDARTPDELMRNADQAMYMAKQAGRNRFCFFTTGLQNTARVRGKAIDELRLAVRQHQFSVHFQPIVELSSGRIVKAEALLRWRHPQSGIKRAGDFIGLAEETGLIGEVGEWVLSEALTCARACSAFEGRPFQIHVNKSAVELMSKASKETWNSQIAALSEARELIALEVAEEILLSDSHGIQEKLESLNNLHIELVVNNFGALCASPKSVKKYGVGNVKIDQSLVCDIHLNGDNQEITGAIIAMAHKLGVKVIATGVETPEQCNWLAEAECDYAQGYLFSEPLACRGFEKLLTSNRRSAAMSCRAAPLSRNLRPT